MIHLKFTKISPTQNMTILVETPVSRGNQPGVAKAIMQRDPDTEQVGFIEQEVPGADFHLQMAGGEFCGNAAISAAALFAQKKSLEPGKSMTITESVSGAPKALKAKVHRTAENNFSVELSMPLPLEVTENPLSFEDLEYKLPLVRFPGIAHVILSTEMPKAAAERAAKKWCSDLGEDALGLMLLKEQNLTPLVFVKNPESLFWERSCASGSAAAAVFLAKREGSGEFSFTQPGGTLKSSVQCDKSGNISSLSLKGQAEILYKGEI